MDQGKLHEISRAFMESRTLLTAAELDIFPELTTPSSAADVAARLGLAPRATESLLNALVAMEIIDKGNGVFSLTDDARRLLTNSSPESILGPMRHSAHLWKRWDKLTEAVRAGTSIYREPRSADDTESFIAAMHHNATARAETVIPSLDLGSVRSVLDVGGGSGAYSIAFARANPQIRSTVFDMPDVVRIADRHIREAGVEDRVTTRAGDMTTDEFGSGYDLVFLSAICHMFGPERNTEILRKAANALAPGGRVIVQDFVLDDDKTTPRHGVVFALHMLVATREGSTYSGNEYCSWMREAGLVDARVVPLPGPTDLVIGMRPTA